MIEISGVHRGGHLPESPLELTLDFRVENDKVQEKLRSLHRAQQDIFGRKYVDSNFPEKFSSSLVELAELSVGNFRSLGSFARYLQPHVDAEDVQSLMAIEKIQQADEFFHYTPFGTISVPEYRKHFIVVSQDDLPEGLNLPKGLESSHSWLRGPRKKHPELHFLKMGYSPYVPEKLREKLLTHEKPTVLIPKRYQMTLGEYHLFEHELHNELFPRWK